MSGWGAGSFENDDAQGFLAELESLGIDSLRTILARAADDPEYLEEPGGSVALAAAEVVATAKGKPPQAVPGQIATWVSRIEGAPSTEMSDLACRAVERVRTNSELKDLWLEADGLNEWSAALRDLEARLRS